MKIRYLALAFTTILFWGVSLIATSVLLKRSFSPNGITFLRFLIPVLIMPLFIRIDKFSLIDRRDRKYFLLMALGGTTLFYFFENSALIYTTVANTALITATIPLFTLLAARMIYAKKILWQNMAGIFFGLSGTFILFYRDLTAGGIHLKGDILVLISVLMWIVYSFSYHRVMKKYRSSTIVYYTFLIGVVVLIPVIIYEIPSYGRIRIDPAAAFSIIFLSVFCSLLGYYFWNAAIRKIGVKVVSNLILLIPLVSITAGILLLGEQLTTAVIFSTVLIITGAYMASFNRPDTVF